MEEIRQLLGLGANSINWYQAALRSVIVYIATLVMVRFGEKRFLGKHTAFDLILGIILGSLVSSVINNLSSIAPTILAGFILVGLHWLFSVITFRSSKLDHFLKGTTRQLIENGKINWDEMRKNNITQEDLLQQLRSVCSTENLGVVQNAYFERSGDISFINYNSQPKILEVRVEKGVKTVRIVMES